MRILPSKGRRGVPLSQRSEGRKKQVPAVRQRFEVFDAGQSSVWIPVVPAGGENIAIIQDVGDELSPWRYERVPPGSEPNPAASVPPVDPLKYQATTASAGSLGKNGSPEMLTVKLRYKQPTGDTSKLLERPFVDPGTAFAHAAPDLKFAAAVAEFGMILRDSQYKGNGSLGAVAEWAQEGKGADENGYRSGFLSLVRKVQDLKARM
jgi:hypothetical protein